MKQILIPLLILSGSCFSAHAQQTGADTINNFGFSYFVNGTPFNTPVPPNGFISFPDTNVGNKSVITFLTTSNSATQQPYTLSNATVSGAGFSLLSSQTNVPIGGTGSLQITFTPTASNSAQTTGALQFQLIASTGTTFNVYISLFVNVLKPQLILSFIDPTYGNQSPISQGGIIQFPATTVKSTSVAKVVVVNTGNGSGTVNSIAITGTGFTLTNEPLTPATVAAGSSYTVGVSFNPLAMTAYQGTLTITLGGVATTINLAGQGANFAFTYSLLGVVGSTSLSPNGSIALPDTPADGVSQSTQTIQVTNTGNQPGTIASILVLGADFQLANLPVLPDTLNPGGIAVFTVVFQPAKAGAATGRLQIGSDLFNLTGNGLGSAISLAVDVGLGPIAVANQAIVSIPSTTVGASRSIYINVTNTGNQSTVISGIGVTGLGFSIPTQSGPISLSPAQTAQFQVQFAPQTVNTITGAVTINNQSLTLLGTGQAPPPLPAVSFTNVAGTLSPQQQPSVGLQLSTAYPYPLTGTVTLSFLSSSFVDDPSIEFITGSRIIHFTIPANSTQAIFTQPSGAPLGTLAAFQTGTVAGTVSLTASGFTVGATDITPVTQPVGSFQIPASVPQLRSLRVQSFVNNQIVLLISGYSTPRNLKSLSFQFTASSGSNLQTSSLNLDVSGAFTSWYTSTASDVFGSQFTVTVTATVTGDPKALQAISVTATNSVGTSAAQSVTLP